MSKLRDNIIWAAGLLEGEGCFRIRANNCPHIKINMTDYDVLARLAELFKTKLPQLSKHKRPKNYKPIYWFDIYGEKAVGVMLTIYPFMGERRKAKIREIMLKWKSIPRRYITARTAVVIREEWASGKYKNKQKLANHLGISYSVVIDVTTGRTHKEV